ncbi:MAG: hypothetical protein U9P42_01680 [Candidatus Fermentibacteria bacterium]|nr:hypothetical protein [Candidatus Fermentibacteria bacterium]
MARRTSARTRKGAIFTVVASLPNRPDVNHSTKVNRNPIIYAKELKTKLIRENLTRKQLAGRHGLSSHRVTQWLCLLKLPKEEKKRVLALGEWGDY